MDPRKPEKDISRANDRHGVDKSYHVNIRGRRSIEREKKRKAKGKKKYGYK